MWDAIVIGGGPAGLSCALLLGRSCRRVLLFDTGTPRNARVGSVSGFLTRDGTPPAELRALGRAEVGRYGVEISAEAVTDARRVGEAWEVRTNAHAYPARALVLATGIRDNLPSIPGVKPFWGRSVVTCPYCDGWERRGQPLAVYGADEGAVEAAVGLLTWSRDVILVTDGRPAPADPRLARHGIDVLASPVLRLEGDEDLVALVFTDGTRRPCTALFVHAGQRPADPLVAALGCELDACGCIVVDHEGRTRVPWLWACGDAATGTQLAIVAAAEGAKAATSLHRALRALDFP
ncbi:MAG: NAD(P)/FAD-dependent oxidoreductase [Myxococcota bacterium]